MPVGRGHIPVTTPITYGVDPFSVGYQRMTPISPDLIGHAEITPGVLHHVVIETTGPAHRDHHGDDRAALARQQARLLSGKLRTVEFAAPACT